MVDVGRSVAGRALTMYVFDGSAAGATPVAATFILGGIHGSEPTAAGVCGELVRFLWAHPDAWAGRHVCVLPVANPDGLAERRRTNQNRVDLNRNFPATNWAKGPHGPYFGGNAPASEPETRALMDVLDRFRPSRIVSVHAMYAPCNNYDGPAEPLARRMAAANGYPVRSTIGYPTPGSLGSWAGVDRRIPTLTLELPMGQSTAQSWEANREALLAAVRAEDVIGRGNE